jgi:nucleotide-binding universal stress UspA family protein
MNRSTAMNDFYEAHRKASLKTVLSAITGKSVDLLSYDDVLAHLRLKGQFDRGREEIPLDKIVGSVGRYTDFTRDFLPRRESDSHRWANVRMATESFLGVPPIEVYKVGEFYFVKDGNHRVSIARINGQDYIEAFVIEVFTRVPITNEVSLDLLIIQEEYANFLEYTRIDQILTDVIDLSVTVAGAYDKLLDHISVHRYYMGIDQDREIPYDEAVTHWYQTVYLPVIEVIREKGLMRKFEHRTETDLYIWMLEYRSELENELGWKLDPGIAADRLVSRFSRNSKYLLRRLKYWIEDLLIPDSLEKGPKTGVWRKKRELQAEKGKSLFQNILVAVQETEKSKESLEQALWVARQENARIYGLHMIDSVNDLESPQVQAIRNHFNWRLGEMNLEGSLAVEIGDAQRKIVKRAVFSDLVVVHLEHAPSTQPFLKLQSGFRTLVRRCAQPLLVVPDKMRPLGRLLVAYDGSPKAKEALFIATYLAQRWETKLYLITTYRSAEDKERMKIYFNEAKKYIITHDIRPHAHMRKGLSGETILSFSTEKNIDLILMGSYGANPIKEVVWGSAIDYVLESVTIPLLICR